MWLQKGVTPRKGGVRGTRIANCLVITLWGDRAVLALSILSVVAYFWSATQNGCDVKWIITLNAWSCSTYQKMGGERNSRQFEGRIHVPLFHITLESLPGLCWTNRKGTRIALFPVSGKGIAEPSPEILVSFHFMDVGCHVMTVFPSLNWLLESSVPNMWSSSQHDIGTLYFLIFLSFFKRYYLFI